MPPPKRKKTNVNTDGESGGDSSPTSGRRRKPSSKSPTRKKASPSKRKPSRKAKPPAGGAGTTDDSDGDGAGERKKTPPKPPGRPQKYDDEQKQATPPPQEHPAPSYDEGGGAEEYYPQDFDDGNARPSRFLPPGLREAGVRRPQDVQPYPAGIVGLTELYDHPESKSSRQFLSQVETISLSVDSIGPLPLTVGCTRVTLKFVVPQGRGFAEVSQLMPVLSVQTPNSPATLPIFTTARTRAPLTPKMLGLVLVETIDRRSHTVGFLGHLVIPLWSKRGAFDVRLRSGHHEDYPVGEAPPLPLTSVKFRVNEENENANFLKFYDHGVFERELLHSRPTELRTAHELGLEGKKAEKLFNEGERRKVDITTYAPYNADRGVMVTVHALHNVREDTASVSHAPFGPTTSACAYKVVVEVSGRAQFTYDHDWTADIQYPGFNSESLHFPNIRESTQLFAIFKVYLLKPETDGGLINPLWSEEELQNIPWNITLYGFGVERLLDDDGFLVHKTGHPVQLYSGTMPKTFRAQLRRTLCEEVVQQWLAKGKISPLPKGVGRLYVGIGDPARKEEIETVKGELAHISLPPPTLTLTDAFCAGGIPDGSRLGHPRASHLPIHQSMNTSFEKQLMAPAAPASTQPLAQEHKEEGEGEGEGPSQEGITTPSDSQQQVKPPTPAAAKGSPTGSHLGGTSGKDSRGSGSKAPTPSGGSVAGSGEPSGTFTDSFRSGSTAKSGGGSVPSPAPSAGSGSPAPSGGAGGSQPPPLAGSLPPPTPPASTHSSHGEPPPPPKQTPSRSNSLASTRTQDRPVVPPPPPGRKSAGSTAHNTPQERPAAPPAPPSRSSHGEATPHQQRLDGTVGSNANNGAGGSQQAQGQPSRSNSLASTRTQDRPVVPPPPPGRKSAGSTAHNTPQERPAAPPAPPSRSSHGEEQRLDGTAGSNANNGTAGGSAE